jgi:hypothetical protein
LQRAPSLSRQLLNISAAQALMTEGQSLAGAIECCGQCVTSPPSSSKPTTIGPRSTSQLISLYRLALMHRSRLSIIWHTRSLGKTSQISSTSSIRRKCWLGSKSESNKRLSSPANNNSRDLSAQLSKLSSNKGHSMCSNRYLIIKTE